jgi:hypothetical protein
MHPPLCHCPVQHVVRKGIISATRYHLLYAGSLALTFVPIVRDMLCFGVVDPLLMLPLAAGLLALRRRGVSKWTLWVPVLLAWQLVHRLEPFASSPGKFVAAWAMR